MKKWKKLPENLKVGQLVYDANGTTYKVVKQTNKDTCKSNNTKKVNIMKEYKVGEYFQIEGKWYMPVLGTDCYKCCFHGTSECCQERCSEPERTDKLDVYFIKATAFAVNLERAKSLVKWLDSLPYEERIEFYKNLKK